MPGPHIHIPYQRLAEQQRFINDNRLDIEVYFSGAVLDLVREDEIRGFYSLFDHRPSVSIHAPFMDLSPGAVDSKVREATMARFRQILGIAGSISAKTVVFHSGYEKWRYGLNMELWLRMSLLTWRPLEKMARDFGVKIAIENIFEENPLNLKQLMEEMNSSYFGVCFDTGHFTLFAKTPLEEWIEALNPYIVELHLHDNDGSFDQHLPMGEGIFDFSRFFGLFKDTAAVHTLEAHSPEHALRSLSFYNKAINNAAGSGAKNP